MRCLACLVVVACGAPLFAQPQPLFQVKTYTPGKVEGSFITTEYKFEQRTRTVTVARADGTTAQIERTFVVQVPVKVTRLLAGEDFRSVDGSKLKVDEVAAKLDAKGTKVVVVTNASAIKSLAGVLKDSSLVHVSKAAIRPGGGAVAPPPPPPPAP